MSAKELKKRGFKFFKLLVSCEVGLAVSETQYSRWENYTLYNQSVRKFLEEACASVNKLGLD